MTNTYLVAESALDLTILRHLLTDPVVQTTTFVDGEGSYGAFSLASTLLATEQRPVALVVDADTTNESAIYERRSNLEFLMTRSAPGARFEVFLAVPEIEIVFFQDQKILERLTNQKFHYREWRSAQYHPKGFLKDVLQEVTGEQVHPARILLKMLTNEDWAVLQKHPLVKDISAFLLSVTTEGALNPQI